MTVKTPFCSCGQPMTRIGDTEFYKCFHHNVGCERNEESCANCRGLDVGTRKKRLPNWVPPKVA